MATSNDVYPNFHRVMGTGIVDLENDDLYLVLLDGSTGFDNTHSVLSDVNTAEISGDGYAAGGEVLPNTTWQQNGSIVEYKSDDVTWQTNNEIAADDAVVYHGPSETLVAYIDFTETKTAIGTSQDKATFRVDFEDNNTVFEIEANPSS